MLTFDNIIKRYGNFMALNAVSLSINRGESLVLIGESGSGKTTLCKVLSGMQIPDSGEVYLNGKKIDPSYRKRNFSDCVEIQYIFQDPYTALEPTYSVRKTLEECTRICNRHRREVMSAQEALSYIDKRLLEYMDYPVQKLSGGQRQKLCIARAIMPYPKVIIADESTSMLDKESAVEIFDLLHRIKEEKKICLLAVLHDIDFSYKKWDRIAVMCEGNIVELANYADFQNTAKHHYSQKLIEAYRYFHDEESK